MSDSSAGAPTSMILAAPFVEDHWKHRDGQRYKTSQSTHLRNQEFDHKACNELFGMLEKEQNKLFGDNQLYSRCLTLTPLTMSDG